MTASGSGGPRYVLVRRIPWDPLEAFALIAAFLLLVVALALLWRNIVDRLQTEAAYEATLTETAERYRLLQLNEATLGSQLEAARQSLDALRAGIPSAAEAQAEMARYSLYAAESGVVVESVPGQAVRQVNADVDLPTVVAQRWNLQVQGQVRNVLQFLDRAAAGRFASWRIENVTIKPDDTLWAGEWDVLATAEVVTYSYAP